MSQQTLSNLYWEKASAWYLVCTVNPNPDWSADRSLLSAKGVRIGVLSTKGVCLGFLSTKGVWIWVLSTRGVQIGILSAKGVRIGVLSSKGVRIGVSCQQWLQPGGNAKLNQYCCQNKPDRKRIWIYWCIAGGWTSSGPTVIAAKASASSASWKRRSVRRTCSLFSAEFRPPTFYRPFRWWTMRYVGWRCVETLEFR